MSDYRWLPELLCSCGYMMMRLPTNCLLPEVRRFRCFNDAAHQGVCTVVTVRLPLADVVEIRTDPPE